MKAKHEEFLRKKVQSMQNYDNKNVSPTHTKILFLRISRVLIVVKIQSHPNDYI